MPPTAVPVLGRYDFIKTQKPLDASRESIQIFASRRDGEPAIGADEMGRQGCLPQINDVRHWFRGLRQMGTEEELLALEKELEGQKR